VGDVNEYLNKHIEEMTKSENPTIARSGKVIEMAKLEFGIGYITPMVIIATGQLLLGNTLAAMGTVAAAATVPTPIAMTCAAIGAIYYGWGALSDAERNEILEKISKGLEAGIELIKSIVRFVTDKTKELLSSKNMEEIKKFVESAAAVFGKTLGDVTHKFADVVGDTFNVVKKKSGKAMEITSDIASCAYRSVSETASDAYQTVSETAEKAAEANPPSQAPGQASRDAEQLARDAAPVIWLLGKTGAGKSSVISKLTGASHVEVGNGFVSCTRTAQLFDFPAGAPLLRFLDTRGLGEPGYDPTEDIAWSQAQAHLVLVVMKACDPSQEELIQAVAAIRRSRPEWPMLVIQTGLHDLYPRDSNDHPSPYPFDAEAEASSSAGVPRELINALRHQRGLFSKIKGKPSIFVPVDFTQIEDGFKPDDYGKSALINAILEVAPESVKVLVRMKLEQEEARLADRRMQALNMRIVYWAAGAAAAGAAPVVGLVTVPVTQAAMLAQLATAYGVDWGAEELGALAGMLGAAIVVNQGALMLFRQLAKIGPWVIPIAAAQDYAVTYGLGRAACVYLQARQDNTEADAEQVKAAFVAGLKKAFSASGKGTAA